MVDTKNLKEITQCYYMGKLYPMYGLIDPSVPKLVIEFEKDHFICKSPTDGEFDLTQALKTCYRRACKKVVGEKLKIYQAQIKTPYKSFSIEDSLVRLGSCNSHKHLTFHYKLILMPPKVIDYVVVHELCHLIHLNHDRSFWRLVGKLMPDYKEAEALLNHKTV